MQAGVTADTLCLAGLARAYVALEAGESFESLESTSNGRQWG